MDISFGIGDNTDTEYEFNGFELILVILASVFLDIPDLFPLFVSFLKLFVAEEMLLLPLLLLILL